MNFLRNLFTKKQQPPTSDIENSKETESESSNQPQKKEIEYKEFCTQWATAVTASKTNPMALLNMDLNVQVRCRNCKKLVNAEDAVQGTQLYCPKCGAGWVVFQK